MKKNLANIKIRQQAKNAGVPFWKIADELGIYDFNFSRMLRHELPEEEKNQILSIIQDLAEMRDEG